MRRSLFRLWSAALLCCLAGHSQTFRAQLTGVVTDASNAVILGAEITATNLETGISYTAASNEQGIYRLLNLQPGQYRLTGRLSGFKTFSQEPITLPVGSSLTMNIKLEVGDVADQVTVVGEAPLLESESSSFGQVVNEEAISEMPLGVRNPINLVVMTPGVVTGSNFGLDGLVGNVEQGRDQWGGDFQMGGGKTLTNEVLLDGSPNTSVDRGYMAYSPPVDSTQEFKVEANSFSAEFDRTTGGVVNIVTKGGTNKVKGTVYNYHRNSGLDANNFFFNRSGREKPPSWQRNQFGGNLGGPIFRNRTFFFANYEGLRQAVPFTRISTVPTAEQRAGDFSRTMAANGRLIVIYDPLTLQRSAAGVLSRSPFPGNVVPSGRIDPVGRNIINFYPEPNQPGNAVTFASNYIANNNAKSNAENVGGRIDHNIGQANRIFGRASWKRDKREAAQPWDLPSANDGAPTDRAANFTVSDFHTFSATLTAEVRASLARHHTQEISPSYGFDVAKLGFPAYYKDANKPFYPSISVADFASQGRTRYYDQIRDTWALQGNVSKLFKRHTLKAGADFRVPRFQLDRNLNAGGQFAFTRGFTQGVDPLRASANAGHGGASLLLGMGASGSVATTGVFDLTRRYHGFYLQDNWKVTSRLTLNLGLRYSVELGQFESENRMAFMDLESTSPLSQAVGFPLRGLSRYVGVDGNPRSLVDTDRNNFAPRFGFGYLLGDKIAIRGGYGIFYAPAWISAYDTNVYPGWNANTPWVPSLDGGLTPHDLISNPFPQGFNKPSGNRDPLFLVGQAMTGWTRQEAVGYAQQWNFTIQRQMSKSLLLEGAYWANKGTKMENRSGWEENFLPNRYLPLGTALNQLVDNPFFGYISRGAVSSARVTRRQLLLPFPQYTSVVRTGPSVGNSIYHAFTLRAEKRLSHGLSFLGSYTVSKTIDDYDTRPYDMENRRLDRAVSATDVPQRLVFSGIWAAPVGKGKAYLAHLPPVLDGVLGGWTVSTISTFQRGQPLSVARATVNDGRSAKLDNPTIDLWFDPTVFTPALPFTYGNTGRTLPDVRADGIRSFDFAIAKNFRFQERYRIRFRADLFNAFNTPQFGRPNMSITAVNVGRVTSQANRPRSIQFGLQFYW